MPDKNLLLGQSKFSAQAVVALLVLALAGMLGNHFTLGLFPGVEVLFGSIAVLIAARTLGLFRALAVGAASVIPLVAVSHHPFGPFLYGGEAVALSFACQYSRRNIVTLDGVYWLLIGMPATWLLHYWVGSGDSGMAAYYALRNGVNGIGNALAAYLVIQLPAVLGRPSHNSRKISLRQAIFTLLVASALMPTLLLTATGIRHQQGVIDGNIDRDLRSLSEKAMYELGGLSGSAEMAERLKAHDRHGETPLTVLDSAGRVVATSRGDFAPGQDEDNISLAPISRLDGESHAPGITTTDAICREGFYYARAMALPGDGGLTLLVEIPAEPYRKAMQWVFVNNVLLMLGIVALIFLLGRLVSNKLTDPLTRLAEVSTNLKWKVLEGESVHLPVSQIIEINTLIANFGDMATGLGKSFRELSLSHEALEQGINERTHELHEINRQLEVEIAERKQFEEKLAERALTLEKTMGELESQKFALDQHSIVAITDPAGKIVYINDKLCEISQYSREELLGQDHRILNSGYHSREFFRRMWETIARGEVWRGEIRNRKKDGSFYWMKTTIVPFLDPLGKPYQYVAIRTDITASKRAGEALLRAKEEAEQANRAKSEFISHMSHELRTPLNAILGFAQLMERDPLEPLSPSQSASVKHIIQAGWHQLALVNEVLDLARVEAGRIQLHLERVMLAQAVQECIDLLSPLSSERRLIIENHVPACGECFVWADFTRLKQVLINLLSNAIKYNREGGAITLACQRSAPDRWKVSVTDTGPGIPADKLDELFVPFNRLDADKSHIQGAGIGLAVAKRLVELMGGEIGVESRPGEGATFWLDLPEHEEDSPEGETVLSPES